jgi:gamma-glutamyltranspeptidase/glutathione hydrolase
MALLVAVVLTGCRASPLVEASAGQAAIADSAMVVSASPRASRVGASMLQLGGNAVDAAVAVAFTLAVTYPTAGNLGGGGLMLAHINGNAVALDFREVAPLAATRDMYLDERGAPTDRSVTGALAVGVPGSVAGLYEAHRKYGTLPWRAVIQPAMELAEYGFAADESFVEDLKDNLPRFSPSTKALYAPNGVPYDTGMKFRNPDLAKTLRFIAERGAAGFYEGETANLIVGEMQRGGGIITREDLKQYRPKWRTPVEFTYRGHRVLTMPPVSSGGLTLALTAGVLEGFDLRAMGAHSAEAIHVIAEAEREAFLRRNTLLADPDFIKIPTASFLSPDTVGALRARIGRTKHVLSALPPDPVRGRHTTHFSVVDARGNAVALTTTLNTGFGSAVSVSGAGFLLNNEMDDFTVSTDAVNQMGLRQGEANAIVPGKRMLSSMTPTIVMDSAGAPLLVTGASGGARIITAVLQVMLNVIDFQMPLPAAMQAPRFHAQDFPDRIDLSTPGIPESTAVALEARGHTVRRKEGPLGFGWAQSILRAGGKWHGVSEPRGNGRAVGY